MTVSVPDIVERLRNRNTPFGWLELADKAAAEIERLTALLGAKTTPGNAEMQAQIEKLMTAEAPENVIGVATFYTSYS